jgi:hypothetical protein
VTLLLKIILMGEGLRSAQNQGHDIRYSYGSNGWFWKPPGQKLEYFIVDALRLHRQVCQAVLNGV